MARLHLNVPAANAPIPNEITLITAGDANGKQIEATVQAIRVVRDNTDNEGDAQ